MSPESNTDKFIRMTCDRLLGMRLTDAQANTLIQRILSRSDSVYHSEREIARRFLYPTLELKLCDDCGVWYLPEMGGVDEFAHNCEEEI